MEIKEKLEAINQIIQLKDARCQNNLKTTTKCYFERGNLMWTKVKILNYYHTFEIKIYHFLPSFSSLREQVLCSQNSIELRCEENDGEGRTATS